MKITGKIENIAFLGSGIMRHEHQVIFVPYSAINDELLVEVVKKYKNYSIAKIVKVITPSLDRTKPLCLYYEKCGGCNLQHIKYENQLKIKENFIRDSFYKISKLNNIKIDPIFASPKQYEYRRLIKLHKQNKHIGFYDTENKNIINIDCCPIFSLNKLQNKEKLLIHKNEDLNFIIDDLIFRYGKESFVQTNEEVSKQIYLDLKILAKEALAKNILDLYSGIGVTSIILAKDAQKVIGIEQNQQAVDLAIKNQKLNNIKNIEFITGTVELKIDKYFQELKPDTIVLNPPRVGAKKEVLEKFIKYKPKNIFYISCMPPTLARDIKILTDFGYKINQIKPYDMFPQTTHVETLVSLQI